MPENTKLPEIFGKTCIIGVDGGRGDGKTNWAVKEVLELSEYWGKPIVSNIKLFGVKYTPFTLDMLTELDERLQNCILLIDELLMYADSYDFLSKNSKKMTILATQLRKRNVIFIYTTQYIEYLPKRIRSQTDFVVTALNRSKTNIQTKNVEWTSLIQVCRFISFNDTKLEPFLTVLFNGKPYWKNYDTNEIVTGK